MGGEPDPADKRPMISIIIATFNRSGVLRFTIESVLRQTLEDWELIVVGDGCTDDTDEVVRGFGDDRISFINLRRRTGEQSGPHNLGFARSRGEYIAYLNHDDLWLEDHLQLCWEAMETERADVVIATCACIGKRAQLPLQFDDLDIALVGLFPDRMYSPLAGVEAVAAASSLLVRRRVVDRLGGWRHSREIHVEPSQDLVFRAWRRRMRVHALNLVTVVVYSAGHRPGSYVDHRVDHAGWLFEHVVVPNRGVEIASLALETNAAFVARHARSSIVVDGLWRTAALLGVNPRALRFRFGRRLGRGQYLDELRALRGVPLVETTESPGPRLRREMVDRGCRFDIGETIRFAAGDSGARLLAAGWSRPDADGVWNDGDSAELLLEVSEGERDGVELVLALRAFRAGGTLDVGRRADVFVAGQLVGTIPLDDSFRPELSVAIPPSAFRRSQVTLRFEFSRSMSPASLGQSPDERRLSIGLLSASIEARRTTAT